MASPSGFNGHAYARTCWGAIARWAVVLALFLLVLSGGLIGIGASVRECLPISVDASSRVSITLYTVGWAAWTMALCAAVYYGLRAGRLSVWVRFAIVACALILLTTGVAAVHMWSHTTLCSVPDSAFQRGNHAGR